MKLWTDFFNREVKHETQPNHHERERDASKDASVATVRLADGNAPELDSASYAPSEARPSARVFVIPTRRLNLYETLLYWQSRGFRLKDDGRGFIEVVRNGY